MKRYLYRYISFETFVGMIQNKALTLVSPTLWEDPKESAPLLKLIEGLDNDYLKLMLATIYEKTYCQSWSLLRESDAMWRIYSYGNRAIQIKVSEENLRSLDGIHMIPVEYSDSIRIDPSGHIDSFLRSLAIKRRAFQHEKEVRLIKYYRFADTKDAEAHIKAFLAINDHPQMVQIIESLFPGLPVDEQVKKISSLLNVGKSKKSSMDVSFEHIPNFIKGIKVHPMAPDWYVEIVKEYCNRNALPFDGKSSLYLDD